MAHKARSWPQRRDATPPHQVFRPWVRDGKLHRGTKNGDRGGSAAKTKHFSCHKLIAAQRRHRTKTGTDEPRGRPRQDQRPARCHLWQRVWAPPCFPRATRAV